MLYNYRCTLVRVIDGDTIEAVVDLGFETFTRKQFRLDGLNAPEKNTDRGQKAKSFLENAVSFGKEITVHTIKDKTEKYGRYLCILTIDGVNVNQALIEQKLAFPWDGKGPRPVE